MKQFSLIRISSTNLFTSGVLLDEYVPFAVTLELPWKNNESNVSCIPPARQVKTPVFYRCLRVNSPNFGETFEVLDVLNRTEILFHIGNFLRDTRGCVLLGKQFNLKGEELIVKYSSLAFKEFLKRTRALSEFILMIRNV